MYAFNLKELSKKNEKRIMNLKFFFSFRVFSFLPVVKINLQVLQSIFFFNFVMHYILIKWEKEINDMDEKTSLQFQHAWSSIFMRIIAISSANQFQQWKIGSNVWFFSFLKHNGFHYLLQRPSMSYFRFSTMYMVFESKVLINILV